MNVRYSRLNALNKYGVSNVLVCKNTLQKKQNKIDEQKEKCKKLIESE